MRTERAYHPDQWPPDRPGMAYIHRAMILLLHERGGTVEAARSIRAELQSGAILTLAATPAGEILIPPEDWGDDSKWSPEMCWNGRYRGHDIFAVRRV